MGRIYKAAELSCRWLLAAVFLYAGIPKLFDAAGFADTVAAYGLIPDAVVLEAALLLVFLEIGAGVGLLFQRRGALHLSTALLVLFIAVLAYGIWLGLDIDCGCFGPGDAEEAHFSGLRGALMRDVLLLLPVFYLYFQPIFLKNN